MTLCPPVFNIVLPRIGVLQLGTKSSRGLANVLGYFWPFTILSLDYVFKLGLEVGHDEYIILCNTGSGSMSGFLIIA